MGEKKLLDSVSIVDTKTGITQEYEIADSKLRGKVDSALENVSADVYNRLSSNNSVSSVVDNKGNVFMKYRNVVNIGDNYNENNNQKYVMNSDITKAPTLVIERDFKSVKMELNSGLYLISKHLLNGAIVKPINDSNHYNLLDYCKKTKSSGEDYNENSETFNFKSNCTLYLSYPSWKRLRIYLIIAYSNIDKSIFSFPMSTINSVVIKGLYNEVQSLKTTVDMCINEVNNEVRVMGDISSDLEPPSLVSAFELIDFDGGYGMYRFFENTRIEFLGSAKMKFKLSELNLFYDVDARDSKEYKMTGRYTANKTEADIIAEANSKLSTKLYVLSSVSSITIENADIELENLAGLLTIPDSALGLNPREFSGVVLRNCRIKSNSTSPLLYLHSLYYKNIVIDNCWFDTPNGDSVVWVLSDSTTSGNPNIPKRSSIMINNSWLSGMKVLIEGNKDTVGEYSMVISNSVINSNNFVTNGVMKPEYDNIKVQRWNNMFN